MVNHYAHVAGINNPVTIITRKRFSGDAVDYMMNIIVAVSP